MHQREPLWINCVFWPPTPPSFISLRFCKSKNLDVLAVYTSVNEGVIHLDRLSLHTCLWPWVCKSHIISYKLLLIEVILGWLPSPWMPAKPSKGVDVDGVNSGSQMDENKTKVKDANSRTLTWLLKYTNLWLSKVYVWGTSLVAKKQTKKLDYI